MFAVNINKMETKDIVSIVAMIFIALLNIVIGIFLVIFQNRFNTRLENIKSELGLLTQNKFSLASEERNAILDFNKSFSNWVNEITNVLSELYYLNDIKILKNYRSQIEIASRNYENSESRCHLFIDDENFRLHNIKLKQSIFNYHHGLMELILILEMKFSNLPDKIIEKNLLWALINNEGATRPNKLYHDVIDSSFEMQKYLRNRLYINVEKNDL